MEIPKDLLWPSIYQEDEEAHDIWHDLIGIPEERIIRLEKRTTSGNMGQARAARVRRFISTAARNTDAASRIANRVATAIVFMEIWNNVFSQFKQFGERKI